MRKFGDKCTVCGASFPPIEGKLYCSKPCKYRASNDRQRERRKRKRNNKKYKYREKYKTCECGKEFVSGHYRVWCYDNCLPQRRANKGMQKKPCCICGEIYRTKGTLIKTCGGAGCRKKHKFNQRKTYVVIINSRRRRASREYSDAYVRQVLCSNGSSLRAGNIPQELVEVKRLQLLIKRKLKHD